MHHLLSSSSALFSWLHALSTVDPMQWTVVSSAYRERLPDITACGMSEPCIINFCLLYKHDRPLLLRKVEFINEWKTERKKEKKKRIHNPRE